jgi:pimeloyl-ACP methyl ester carboxylesterase
VSRNQPHQESPRPRAFAVTDRSGEPLSIVADVWGPNGGRPVLLIHGGGQTRHSWAGTARALAARGWQAIAYDQRGHGQSGRSPSADYEPVRFAQDLAEIAAQLDAAPVVVGASLGGIAAMVAEGELAPGSLAALVLVDITPRMERAGVDRIVGFMLDRAEAGFESLDEAADAVAAYQPHRRRPENHDGLRKNLRLDDDGRWRWHWDPALFTSPTGLGAVPGPATGRLDEAAAKVTVPTLLVRGKLSDLVSEETARHFLEIVPHAEFVDVTDAGHMVAGDQNDRFSDAVLEFLARV